MAAIVCCQSRLHAYHVECHNAKPPKKRDEKNLLAIFTANISTSRWHTHTRRARTAEELSSTVEAKIIGGGGSGIKETTDREKKMPSNFFSVFDRFSAGLFFSFASIFDGNDIESNRNMVFKWFSSFSFGNAQLILPTTLLSVFHSFYFIFFSHFCTKNEIASD